MVMVRFVVQIANEPARRFQLLWNLVGCGLATLYMITGAGYAVGGDEASNSPTLHLLTNLLRPIGGYHAHGFIMMGLALALTYGLSHYRRVTRWTLLLVLLYSLIVAFMIIGGWFFYPISFAAPFWYLFTAFLTGLLLVLAPPLKNHGRLSEGEERA